jgi:hypothetical protein
MKLSLRGVSVSRSNWNYRCRCQLSKNKRPPTEGGLYLVATNNISVVPINARNPVQAHTMHIFSNVAITLTPQHNASLGELKICDSSFVCSAPDKMETIF